jgi:hypothetical protein
MRSKFVIVIYILLSLVLTQPKSEKIEMGGADHISLIIHEDLINEFFANMGKIKGELGAGFDWSLKNPRIRISQEKAIFKAEIQVKSSLLSVTRDVIGKVDISYSKEDNLIIVSVVEADVIVDIGGYDLGKVDIGKHFTKSLRLNGPQAVSDFVEFKLPSGGKRRIDIEVVSYSLKLIDGAIKVSTSLGFESVIIP